jgi:hypothetical protein
MGRATDRAMSSSGAALGRDGHRGATTGASLLAAGVDPAER